MAILEINDLKTHFYTEDGIIPAVDGVSFTIEKGETLGLVGESGCGKSVTSLSVMRLIPCPPGRILNGRILFNGEDLLKKSIGEMQKTRGNQISMIFQEPMTSLNPVFTIGRQISEVIILHQAVSRSEARSHAIDMLKLVGIPSPERRIREYPHQMSGGMRQRAMIAMALACRPKLLIADEPTTALDVTVQAQILDLMKKIREEFGMAILLITHDLGVVAEVTDRVVVMYAGNVVECAETANLFQNPLHPYTKGLLGSIAKLSDDRRRLHVINGNVPNPFQMPEGCRFAPRCPIADSLCRIDIPELKLQNPGHWVRCRRVD